LRIALFKFPFLAVSFMVNDLVQEHSVCNQKQLIESRGANKADQSISRVTRSADNINEICSNFDASILLKPKKRWKCFLPSIYLMSKVRKRIVESTDSRELLCSSPPL
jgi:hypothetical protein